MNALIDAGADVNAKNDYGETALIYVARGFGNERAINTLINAGADVKAKNSEGKMAVDYARDNEKLKGTNALRRLEQLSR